MVNNAYLCKYIGVDEISMCTNTNSYGTHLALVTLIITNENNPVLERRTQVSV